MPFYLLGIALFIVLIVILVLGGAILVVLGIVGLVATARRRRANRSVSRAFRDISLAATITGTVFVLGGAAIVLLSLVVTAQPTP